jgi:hypothetical protein
MKKQIALLVVVATLACCSISQASITSATWYSLDHNTLNCTSNAFASDTLGMSGTQKAPAAHMVADIFTDTTADPTLTLSSIVNNDTGFAWNGYQVNVVMSVPFSFTAPAPNAQNPPVNDWFLAAVVPPTLQGGASPWAGYYEGTLDFSAGTSVGIGEKLDFQYTISFGSSTHYILTQEMIPSEITIPEPSTVALLAIGGLGFALRLRRNSRIGA